MDRDQQRATTMAAGLRGALVAAAACLAVGVGLVLLWFVSTPSAHAAEGQGKQTSTSNQRNELNELNELVPASLRTGSLEQMKAAVDSLTKNTQAAATSAQAELEGARAELNREVTTTVDATNTALAPVAEPVADAITPALAPVENAVEPATTPLNNVHDTMSSVTEQGSAAAGTGSNATAPTAPAVAAASSVPVNERAQQPTPAKNSNAVDNAPSQRNGPTEPAPTRAPAPRPAPVTPLAPMIPATSAGLGSGSPTGGSNGQRGAPADAAIVVPIFVLGGLSSSRFVGPALNSVPAGPTSEPDVSPD